MTTELHTFSDASSYAYGCCSYLRIVDDSQHSNVSLIMSKSRVGPQKAVTIPRLELQAATLSVRLAEFLQRELKYSNLKTYFWTDSETVLGYIANEAKAFHTFVCNRVQRIKDSSTTQQWHHVTSQANPADLVSRGCNLSQMSEAWLHGPEFLTDPTFKTEDLPTNSYPLVSEDPEIRKVFLHATYTEDEDKPFISYFNRFSQWSQVLTSVKNLLKFRLLTQSSLDVQAENQKVFHTILKMLQRAYFAEEMDKLQEDLPLTKKSPLYKLDLFIDSEGIHRVGGRLTDSISCYEVKHPAVMPAKSHLAKLNIRDRTPRTHVYNQSHQG